MNDSGRLSCSERSRAELADLLRVRRASLVPGDIGRATSRRRRTVGLRREEVAEAAGVSVSLYASLEQGRNIPVSTATIDAITRALRMTEADRVHARLLVSRNDSELREQVSSKLQRFVMFHGEIPIFVVNYVWDIVLTNHASIVVFGHNPDPARRRNALESAYLDEHTRELFVDWRQMARSSLELFRLYFSTAREDTRASSIVARLIEASPEFAEDWKEHRVREHPRDLHVLRHADLGVLTLEPTSYIVPDAPHLRVIALIPYDAATREALHELSRRPQADPAQLAYPSGNHRSDEGRRV